MKFVEDRLLTAFEVTESSFFVWWVWGEARDLEFITLQ